MEKLLERPLSALDAIYTRRSVRSYTSQRIDASTVRALLDAAVQSPTAMLEQPRAFVVVQDPESRPRTVENAQRSQRTNRCLAAIRRAWWSATRRRINTVAALLASAMPSRSRREAHYL
jgi:nitroreductase